MNDFQPSKPWTLITTIWAFLSKPRKSFAAVAQSASLGPPLAFIAFLLITCCVLRVLVHLLVGPPPTSLAWLIPLPMEALWAFIAIVGLQAALRAVKREPTPTALTLRLIAYSLGPWIIYPLRPLLPVTAGEIMVLLILVSILAILFAGLRSACKLTPPLAAAVIIIDLVVVMIAASVFRQL